MQIPAQGPVVVGADGGPAASAAVRLAAREALSRGRMLQIVHAFTWPGGTDFARARGAATRVVEEAVSLAQRSTPGVRARGQLVDGPPGRELLRLSRRAVLLVVGAGRLPPGSPVIDLAARAWCPVAVTRCPRPPSGPVLAALDGSAYSVLALRFAADEAARLGNAVHALHVAADGDETAAERLLDETLAAADITGVRVRRHVITGQAAEAVPRAAARAALIVLGPRGSRAGLHLGTVAGEVLHRGTVPAVFVHAARGSSRRLPAAPGRPSGFSKAF